MGIFLVTDEVRKQTFIGTGHRESVFQVNPPEPIQSVRCIKNAQNRHGGYGNLSPWKTTAQSHRRQGLASYYRTPLGLRKNTGIAAVLMVLFVTAHAHRKTRRHAGRLYAVRRAPSGASGEGE
jgi:hypothetical protein